MRSLPALAFAAALLCTAFSACKEERQSFVRNIGSGEDVPTMLTLDVNTFISDSGYTKYHITTPLWAMYEDAQVPYWSFPQGIDLEQYDRQLNIVSTMRCDSAKYFSQKKKWQLDGNVVMVNTQADSFLTQQVFWDQSSRSIYSDSFIHIVRTDRVIEGYGFKSDEAMSEYIVHKPTGIFPVKKREPEAADSALPADNSRRRLQRNAPNEPLMFHTIEDE